MSACRGSEIGWFSKGSSMGVVLLALLLTAKVAQAQAATESKPRQVSWYGDPQAPNLSGVWLRLDSDVKAGPRSASKEGWQPWPPPLRPPYAAIWKKRMADATAGTRSDDPVRACLPPGMPRYMTGTNGSLLIIQTPGRVMLYRDGIPVRRVWLTGVTFPAPKDLEDFFNGNSIGHYAGSDLVTEVIGMKDLPIDSTGVPHSEGLKISERYHRIDKNTLRVEVTLIDPAAYTKAMTSTVLYKAVEDTTWEPEEFVCTPGTDYHPEKYVQ